MTTVRQLLLQKGTDVWTVDCKSTLRDAIKLMANKGVGAVLILDGEKITGIFSERDYVRESAKVDGLSLTTPINNLMTHLVFYIQPDATVDECMALMTEKKFRHLPVVENEKLVGLISIGDVVKQYISQKDIHIRSLESYILGREYNQ